MNIIAVANGKGGVGKSTTTVNLAGILEETMRVLVVDSDPQESTTWWMERSEGERAADIVQECRSYDGPSALPAKGYCHLFGHDKPVPPIRAAHNRP